MTLPVSVSIQLDVSLFSPSRCCLHLMSGLYTADLNRTTNRSSTRVPSALVRRALVVRFALQLLVFSLTDLSTSADVTVPTSTCNSLCLALLSKTSSRCCRPLLALDSIFHVHFYSLEDFIHARIGMNSTSRRYEVFRRLKSSCCKSNRALSFSMCFRMFQRFK